MARIETRDDDPQIPPPPVGPPRGDEGLDDWFTRRLEAQGIAARGNGFPASRVFSVIALVVAVGALLWVIHSASGSSTDATSSSNPTTTPQTQGSTGSTGPTSTGTTGSGPTTKGWSEVKVTIINGNGQTGAAGTAQTDLNKAGWNVVGTTNTVNGATVDQTEVVYPPGKKGPATAVGSKLGLPVVAQADAGDAIPPDLTSVAIVLGPEPLPTSG